ncbi:MAG TPA: CDP-alcohol phosphatidyltransferase family protein [bacterium]|nr:CDP-alcohol phosphatidyltransferase family protein [bacterium]
MCVRLGLTPNILTALGLVCAAGAAVAFWQERFWLGVFLMLLTSLLDMLDGATARAGNLGTVFGAVLDHNVDRVGEFLIILGIVLSGHVHPGWGLFALFGMWSASYARAAAESIGKMKTCAVGFVGRLEKFIIILAGAVFEVYFPMKSLQIAMIAVGAISFITTIQRLIFAHRELTGRTGGAA